MFYRQETEHQESEESVGRRELHLKLLQGLLLVVFLLSFYHLYKGPHPWSKKVIDHIQSAAVKVENPKALTSNIANWIASDVAYPDALRPKEHAIVGHYWAAAGTATISFLLLIAAPLWLPRGQKEGKEVAVGEVEAEGDDENAGESGIAKLVSTTPIFYLLLLVALGSAVYLRAPRLGHSLWNDEEYAMRRYAHGGYEMQADGKKAFEPVSWTDTLAENDNGNNHVLHSVLSRASLSAWRSLNHKEPQEFSETVLRMPSLVAGVLTILLVALIGFECGLPWVGAGAAWLLVLHPWHIRYSCEAKGYSLMLFFLCLSLLGLIRAHRLHKLGGWLLFAIGEAGFLCSFPGALYVAIAVNAVLALECLIRWEPRRLGSLVGFNLLAAIPVLILLLPSVPQILGFLAHDPNAHALVKMDKAWLYDIGSHLSVGVPADNPMPEAHSGTSWRALILAAPGLMKAFAAVLTLLTALGLVVSLLHGTGKRLVVVAVSLAGVLAAYQANAQQQISLAWYYIFLLVPAVFAAPVALSRAAMYQGIFIAALVGLFGYGSETARHVLMETDRQPIRQMVQAIRKPNPEAITATFGVSDRQSQSYDPEVNIISKPEELDALIARANAEHRPLYAYFCGLTKTAERCPGLIQRISGAPDFKAFKELKGTEEMFSYLSYAWVPQR